MRHPQPATTIKIDNKVTKGFTKNNIQLKKLKSWDIKLHWLRDRQNRKQFVVSWEKGTLNKADYFTKHHSISHHRQMRPKYVLNTIQEDTLFSF